MGGGMIMACVLLLEPAADEPAADEPEADAAEPQSGIIFRESADEAAPEPVQAPPEEDAERDPDDFIDQPAVDSEDHGAGTRPDWAKPKRPAYPPLRVRFGITAGPNTFGGGAGVAYFAVPYVGIGLELDDFGVWDDFGTFNVFEVTPLLWLLPLPRFVVTPFVRGGFGGEFISRRLGAYGRWVAGSGLLIRIRRRWSIELGVDIDGRIPEDRWRSNLQCGPLGDAACTTFIVPRLGVGASFDTM